MIIGGIIQARMGSTRFPEKILNPFKSKSGKSYVNLLGEDGKQKKISIEKLLEISS